MDHKLRKNLQGLFSVQACSGENATVKIIGMSLTIRIMATIHGVLFVTMTSTF